MKRKQSKVLLCQRCRSRKVKCDYQFPCSQCVKAKVECVQTVDDMRKKRPGVSYVLSLQARLEGAEALIALLERALAPERQQLLDDYRARAASASAGADHDWPPHSDGSSTSGSGSGAGAGAAATSSGATAANSATSANPNSASTTVKLEDDDERNVVYGPTSVFRDDTLAGRRAALPAPPAPLQILGTQLNKDPEVLHCLKLFFTWQYPDHNMFIFREAFLIDFFAADDRRRRASYGDKAQLRYCLTVLVYALCAVGARMLEDDVIYAKLALYYRRAKQELLELMLKPLITLMQAFLVLAFYDICQGHNSSGWMMSGNAIRMGYDLGFQLNPEVWFVAEALMLPLDVLIRLRIYWGAYMADHFISLVLGRPSFLKSSDATIRETNDLPDLEWIDDYTYRGYIRKRGNGADGAYVRLKDLLYISLPLNCIIRLINISELMLNEVFTKADLAHADFAVELRLSQLTEYNHKIMSWKELLPPDLKWDRAVLRQLAENPTLTYIRYYYYILLLCLNRPFLGMFLKRPPQLPGLLLIDICNDAIDDLYVALDRFKQTHGLRRALIFMVYCLILLVLIILLTTPSAQLTTPSVRTRIEFFMEVLRGASKTWGLADKSYHLISIKLSQLLEEAEANSANSAPPDTSGVGTPSDIPTNNNNNTANATNDNTTNGNTNGANATTNVPVAPGAALPMRYYAPYLTLQPLAPPPPPLTVPQLHLPLPLPFAQAGNRPPHISNLVNPVVQLNFLVLANPAFVNPGEQLANPEEDLDFLGGPPVLMTLDLFNEDWEQLFPDYGFTK